MQEQEIHLRDYLRIISKRRFIVVCFFIITVALVLLGTFTATPQYEASTQLLIEKNEVNPDPLTSSYVSSRFDPEFLETQFQIIKGFNVCKKVVAKLSLDVKYAEYFIDPPSNFLFFDTVKKWLQEISQSSTPSQQPIEDKDTLTLADEIADYLSEEISVKPVRNSRIVNISFMAENPVLAKMIVNTLAKAYMEEIMAFSTSSTEYTIKWMSEKAGEELAKLEKSEKSLQEYMRANDIVTVENKITVIPEKLAEFGSQHSKAEAKRKELESIYDDIKTIGLNNYSELATLPLIASNQSYLTLLGKIQVADQKIVELSKKYGHKHPVMIRAKDERQSLEEEKNKEVERLVKSIKKELDQNISNESNLANLLDKTKNEAMNLNEKFIQYGILKRDVDTNRTLYNSLLKQVKEQNITQQTKSVNIWIVAEAKTPEKPAKPKKLLNVLLGIIVGVFGGIGLAFFIEYLDNTVKNPADAENRLGLTVLGVVELFRKKGIAVYEALDKEPMSSFAECYKTIRSAVLLSSADHPPKSILVTSMSPQEGKTTTSINLAMAIAQADYKVVLIDADLRRPSIHKNLGITNQKGLSSYLAGASDMDIIAKYPMKSLSIIPSGPIPPNPSELLGSKRMKDLLAVLRNEFDFIIIDSAPVMGATDALILSNLTHGTMIVAKAGETTYDILTAGLKALTDIKAHILGMVINGVDFSKTYYQRYYGYYNYYSSDNRK